MLAALGARLGKSGGRRAQCRLGGIERGLGLGGGGAQLRLFMVARACRFEAALLLAETAQDALGLGDVLLLPGKVARGLREPRLKLGLARLGARFFAVERVALDAQAMQHRRAGGLLVAQRLELLGGLGLLAQRLALGLGLLGDRRERPLERGLFLIDMGASADPSEMMQERLGGADLAGNFAITLRLARLALQRLKLRGELADEVGEAGEVGLGRGKPELGLVPAAVQAGDSGRVFEHAPALLRRGVDDLADPALAHERGRARPGRRILEQQPHVAGAHIPAVDPVSRARLALDPSHHFERVAVVELGRRFALAVVDEEGDLGAVARGAILGAGEDHVLHRRAAHALIRGLAHGPAQRLEQVRLAAAIGPDDAGEPAFDQEFGRFDEGLEAEKAKTGDLHV